MLAPIKVKMSGIEKKSEQEEHRTTFARKKGETRMFLEVSRCSSVKQWQRNVKKKVCCTCKVFFLLIDKRAKLFFLLMRTDFWGAIFVAVAASHYTIIYFV